MILSGLYSSQANTVMKEGFYFLGWRDPRSLGRLWLPCTHWGPPV